MISIYYSVALLILNVVSIYSQNDDVIINQLAQLNKEVLSCNNNYRRTHQAPDLSLSVDLILKAQEEADRLAAIGKLEFSDVMYNGERLGSNLYGKSVPTGNLGRESCNAWYAQKSFYTGQWASNVGQFTQMVWKSSRELGVGKATSANGWTYIVALYYPAGNDVTQYKQNVFTIENKNSFITNSQSETVKNFFKTTPSTNQQVNAKNKNDKEKIIEILAEIIKKLD